MIEAILKAIRAEAAKTEARLARGRFVDYAEARELVGEARGLRKAERLLSEGPTAKVDDLNKETS